MFSVGMHKQIPDHLNASPNKEVSSSSSGQKLESQSAKGSVAASNFLLKRILRTSDVIALTSLSRAQLYRMMAAGTFPASIKLSPRRSGWVAEDLAAWIEERKQASSKRQSDHQR